MTQEELRSHKFYIEKRDELISFLNFALKWQIGSGFAFFITIQLVFSEGATTFADIIVWIIFILSILIFVLMLFIKRKANNDLYYLEKKYRLLDLKMKGYEKQLKSSGFNVNINQNSNHEKLDVDSSKSTVIQKLEELKKMKDNNFITDEEYESKRKQIIDKY